MHYAPSVSFPLGRSPYHAVLLVLLAILGLVFSGLWWAQTNTPGRFGALVCLLWLASSIWLLTVWWKSPRGYLRWDGQGWMWEPEFNQPGLVLGALEVRLDFQVMLLLEFKSDLGKHSWHWAEKSSAPLTWKDFRRALYAAPMPAEKLSSIRANQ